MPELDDDERREVVGGMRVAALVVFLAAVTLAVLIGVGIGFLSALIGG
jgi:ABC-type dipeptide/oligopeptide/nickel transport system permease subunit